MYIRGHSYRHDLFELIRVFFPDKEIVFIDKLVSEGEYEYLIESVLVEELGNLSSLTNLYKNGRVVIEHIESINYGDIGFQQLKRHIKIHVKKGLYTILSKELNISLPWGVLTGIRPIKIVHDLFEQGVAAGEIKKILKRDYKIDKNKIALMLEIAQVQKRYIYPLNADKYSLYISIPFCPSKCTYCSFPSYEIEKKKAILDSYINTLLYEMRKTRDIMQGKSLNTIYIGGGTPTAISTKQLERVVKEVKLSFKSINKEFTVEAGRPDTINIEVLHMLKDYEVNRISINPQTMNNKTLKIIGRKHDNSSVINAYKLAKTVGFGIINMDMILGLPGEKLEDVKNTLHQLKMLNPENLTVHMLSFKKGSNIYNNGYRHPLEDIKESEEMLDLTQEFAGEMGFFPYYLYRQKQILGNLENIGYSKRGKECIYNISMMEEKETIIGLGLGSVSKIFFPNENRIEHISNFRGFSDYFNRVDELVCKKEQYIKLFK